jgi:hypothetical protein
MRLFAMIIAKWWHEELHYKLWVVEEIINDDNVGSCMHFGCYEHNQINWRHFCLKKIHGNDYSQIMSRWTPLKV